MAVANVASITPPKKKPQWQGEKYNKQDNLKLTTSWAHDKSTLKGGGGGVEEIDNGINRSDSYGLVGKTSLCGSSLQVRMIRFVNEGIIKWCTNDIVMALEQLFMVSSISNELAWTFLRKKNSISLPAIKDETFYFCGWGGGEKQTGLQDPAWLWWLVQI